MSRLSNLTAGLSAFFSSATREVGERSAIETRDEARRQNAARRNMGTPGIERGGTIGTAPDDSTTTLRWNLRARWCQVQSLQEIGLRLFNQLLEPRNVGGAAGRQRIVALL